MEGRENLWPHHPDQACQPGQSPRDIRWVLWQVTVLRLLLLRRLWQPLGEYARAGGHQQGPVLFCSVRRFQRGLRRFSLHVCTYTSARIRASTSAKMHTHTHIHTTPAHAQTGAPVLTHIYEHAIVTDWITADRATSAILIELIIKRNDSLSECVH